jgi:ribosomal protein L11 methyltransferase
MTTVTEKNKGWIEVSLAVDGEMAEAVAEVLSRYLPNGVAIESTAIRGAPESMGIPVGLLRVRGFFPVGPEMAEIQSRITEALWYLSRIHPLPEPTFSQIQDEDWTQAWRANYRPIEVGRRLMLLPPWFDPPAGDRLPLFIDPGMAFGTGTHPTTQLCLEALETWVRVGQPLIDIGIGSGVLSLAALKLGTDFALGVDTDPDAIADAYKNAALNGLADRLYLGVGSVDTILGGGFPLSRAPVVLANILASVIQRLMDQGLIKLLLEDGILILSGILVEQEGEILASIKEHPLQLVERRQKGDWIALVMKKVAKT